MITIPIEETQRDYLERLAESVASRSDIITRLIEKHAQDVDTSLFDSAVFKRYEALYEDAYAEYEMAKEEFSRQLPSLVAQSLGKDEDAVNIRNCRWNVDFARCNVTIEGRQ